MNDNTARQAESSPYSTMMADELLEPFVYEELYSIENSFQRGQRKVALLKRAGELRIKQSVLMMLKEYDREVKRKQQEEKIVTRFDPDSNGVEYENLFCGGWDATEDGIFTMEASQVKQTVCYHPILPVRRLKNLQTGEEQITLAFKRNLVWEEITIPKITISTARSITELAKYGIAVTSENAKLLVRYLADIENWNSDKITLHKSTSKLGWHGNDFIPFDSSIQFDGENQFRNLFESIAEFGDFNVWLDHVTQLRKSGSVEVRLALAASFGSILLRHIGIMPFIVDFWTMTEAGKTVLNMVATSVWANPAEAKYIGDFKTTDIALEARLDMLNNLPVFLDDTSKASKRIRENFESVIYDICSGKGKSRSNLKIGTERERNWQNIVICNGERPLSSYTFQGGAINRILEVECKTKIFSDPAKTADIVRYNYGFAGRLFVSVVKSLSKEEIKAMHQSYVDKLTTDETMQKQVIALATLLTADELIEKHIFHDNIQLKPEEVKQYLTNKNEISDGERCYRYLMDVLIEEEIHFSPDKETTLWGIIQGEDNPFTGEYDEYVYFFVHALEGLLKKEGFSRRSFTSWARKNDLLQSATNDRDTILKKVFGKPVRCIAIKINHDFDTSSEPKFE